MGRKICPSYETISNMNTQDTSKVLDASGKPIGRPKTAREHFRGLWQRFHRWIIGMSAALGLILAVLTQGAKILDFVRPNRISNNQAKAPIRQVSVDPNTHRTPLYSRTRSRVDERTEYLIREKIDPWLLISTGLITITLHDGSPFDLKGFAYSGSPARVFWDLIEPFLKRDIREIFDEVGAECRDHDIDASIPLEEAAMLLRGMVWRVYNRMADIDQRLRTKSSKEKPPRRDVQPKADHMVEFLDGQLEAAKALYSRDALEQE